MPPALKQHRVSGPAQRSGQKSFNNVIADRHGNGTAFSSPTLATWRHQKPFLCPLKIGNMHARYL
jgi:hypothetical protein